MKYFSILLISLLFFSCGPNIYLDYDEDVDFSKYHTYNFYPDLASGLSPLENKRIKKVTDSLIQQKGLSKSISPDIYINFYGDQQLVGSRNTVGIGVGTGSRSGVGVSGTIPVGGRIIDQELTIDFIDRNNDQLVWQAVIIMELKERASPFEKEKQYYKAIQKALKKYPPN